MAYNPTQAGNHAYAFRVGVQQRSDRLMNYFLSGYFLIGLIFAVFYDTWLMALGVGGLLLVGYYSAKRLLPASDLYQYVLSTVLALFMAQFIYQLHGLFEMHFFAFIGSAVLITYQKWKLQLPFLGVVLIHHAVLGYLQNNGFREVYFTRLDTFDLLTFFIHIGLTMVIFFIGGLWSYQLQQYNEGQLEQTRAMAQLQNEAQLYLQNQVNEQARQVSQQKHTALVLQQSLHREQELNQLKSQFVSIASHEFRTPLMTIQSSVDLIKLYLDIPAASARVSMQKHLGVIEKQIDQFNELLTDVLTIGQIEAGKLSYAPRSEDVMALCEDLIATHFSLRSDQRSVQLMSEGTPRRVDLDAKRMGHVLINLLSNAFKFSVKVSPILRVVFEPTGLQLQVIDQGIGIPAADVANLFQAFFRSSNTVGIQGTGLGLVIARQFVELHNGTLEVQSEPHKGTVFTIILPLGSPDQALAEEVNIPLGI